MPGKISTVVLPRRQMQLSEAEPLGQGQRIDGKMGLGHQVEQSHRTYVSDGTMKPQAA